MARHVDRPPSSSLHGDPPPSSNPFTECGVELPELRLFLFAPNLSSSSLSSSEPWNSNGSTFFFVRAMPAHGGSERSTCWAVARAWREQPRACFESPSSTAHAPGAAFQVPCATPPAAENCMSRTTAISPHHPAISTRRRGRGAGRFHTRSKRPATPRGECDGRLLGSGPARHAHALVSQGDARTSARARVRTSHARAAAAASTRQVVLSRQLVRRKTTQKACARRRRGRHWAARPRQTRAPVCCSRRAQCGARERPCRAALALAVPT